MRMERATKEYGSGSGKETFSSEMFSVTLWKLSGGDKTEITSRLGFGDTIEFDGAHDFNSDDKCVEQFTAKEVLRIIEQSNAYHFDAGKLAKSNEIKKCLGV